MKKARWVVWVLGWFVATSLVCLFWIWAFVAWVLDMSIW